MSKLYQGQCLCGEIKFEVDEIQPRMAHCHCTMCRKFHGAAFSTFGEAKVEHFRWLSGMALIRTFQAKNGTKRQFCDTCGSSLRFIPSNDKGEYVEFSLSLLDDDIPHRSDAHIYTKFRASWYDITDGLPVFSEGRK